MEILIAILALALLVVVILVVSAPLRATRGARQASVAGAEGEQGAPLREGRGAEETEHGEADREGIAPAERRAELETAREAKYREIRDTELDYRTGKLSQEDFAATDSALRAEAVEILDWLDAAEDEPDS
ncbi:MAG TPA: hypothetical protein VGL54_10075 [Solirubrobacteraceae bacterium]